MDQHPDRCAWSGDAYFSRRVDKNPGKHANNIPGKIRAFLDLSSLERELAKSPKYSRMLIFMNLHLYFLNGNLKEPSNKALIRRNHLIEPSDDRYKVELNFQ